MWNERDGPIKTPPPSQSKERRRPVAEAEASTDLRKAFMEGSNSAWSQGNVNSSNLSGNRVRARHYSVQSWRNGRNEGLGFVANSENSKLERNSNNIPVNRKIPAKKPRRYFRNGDSSDSEFDSGDDDDSEKSSEWDVKKMGSSASVGKYDVKISKRRIPLHSLEDEIDISEQIEEIRHEINRKKLLEGKENEGKEEEESILSEKRCVICLSL